LGSSDDDSDEEDDTAELLRELEKIKRERAEEKARQVSNPLPRLTLSNVIRACQEREQSASANEARDAEIATSNPLLNLQAALGQTPGGSSTTSGSFAVKRRWDDGESFLTHYDFLHFYLPIPNYASDLIFKNQATSEKPSGHFVNDLLRTEFHKSVVLASCSLLPLIYAVSIGDSWLSLSK